MESRGCGIPQKYNSIHAEEKSAEHASPIWAEVLSRATVESRDITQPSMMSALSKARCKKRPIFWGRMDRYLDIIHCLSRAKT